MKILYICKLLSDKGNGVVVALKNEVKYLQNLAEVAIYSLGVEFQDKDLKKIYSLKDYENIRALPDGFSKPDLVVFEEIYKLDYMKLYRECLKLKIPYIIIPHGSLVDKAQSQKKLKHMVANILLFNRYIKKAQALEFLNKGEMNKSHFKCKQKIIIPNPIEIFERKIKRREDHFIFIYIGRYDIYTKGLDFLIDNFIYLKNWCEDNKIILELYGPIDNAEEINNLKNKIKDNKCEDIIQINGPVYGDEKLKKLQEASVFIQTSRHEAQPMGIIEALSFGIPAVVTRETNFGNYCNEQECGIGVSFNAFELRKAIKEIYENKEYYKKCTNNAIIAMKRDFEIKQVTKETIEKYKKIVKEYKNN